MKNKIFLTSLSVIVVLLLSFYFSQNISSVNQTNEKKVSKTTQTSSQEKDPAYSTVSEDYYYSGNLKEAVQKRLQECLADSMVGSSYCELGEETAQSSGRWESLSNVDTYLYINHITSKYEDVSCSESGALSRADLWGENFSGCVKMVEDTKSIRVHFVPTVEKEMFIATVQDKENGLLNFVIFNPTESKVVVSKEISFDSLLGLDNQAWGTNSNVQYNHKTKEIFFWIRGYSHYDGSCINKDGTCVSRLYKISLDQTKPMILFESNVLPHSWVVNSFDNSLLLSFLEKKTQSIKKINGQDGKVVFTKEYQFSEENPSLTEFVLSQDGKDTYQAGSEFIKGKSPYEVLRIRKIDNSSGDITEQEISRGGWFSYGTDISPDNNYLAFYSGATGRQKLYIYEFSTKKLTNVSYEGLIKNYTLVWSGDSKKLLYLTDTLNYYDIPSAKSVLVSGDPQNALYVYAWAPSVNYFVYRPQDNSGIKIFDMQNNQVIDTQFKTKSVADIKGIGWY